DAAIRSDGQAGSLLEINCETDFVAKNDGFRSFVQELAEKALTTDGNMAEECKPEIVAKVAEIGENIICRRNLRFVVEGAGAIASYIHHGATIGVLLEAGCEKPETAADPKVAELLRDVCMHIAASSPAYIDRDSVPAEAIAAEREIFAKQVEGKPANIVEKIVDGKIGKYYEQVCLLEQPFVRDQDQKVGKLLEQQALALGDKLMIRRFARFQVGEALD
ncbi:MAG: translation elongation factor Ts, partial [Lentisphaerae bacterium]|nr:translation elongation factor Ts [Lentisphaerota bacterium]